MLTRLEAIWFRSLYCLEVKFDERFQVFIGQDTRPKHDIFAALQLISRIAKGPLEFENEEEYRGLFWKRNLREDVELAIEVRLPRDIQELLVPSCVKMRYEVSLGRYERQRHPAIKTERLWLLSDNLQIRPLGGTVFIEVGRTPPDGRRGRLIAKKSHGICAEYLTEPLDYTRTYKNLVGYPLRATFRDDWLGTQDSIWAKLKEDPDEFPASIWMKYYLAHRIQCLVLPHKDVLQEHKREIDPRAKLRARLLRSQQTTFCFQEPEQTFLGDELERLAQTAAQQTSNQYIFSTNSSRIMQHAKPSQITLMCYNTSTKQAEAIAGATFEEVDAEVRENDTPIGREIAERISG